MQHWRRTGIAAQIVEEGVIPSIGEGDVRGGGLASLQWKRAGKEREEGRQAVAGPIRSIVGAPSRLPHVPAGVIYASRR